jgi:hypothetical protein
MCGGVLLFCLSMQSVCFFVYLIENDCSLPPLPLRVGADILHRAPRDGCGVAPVHVINIETKDTHEEAVNGARAAWELMVAVCVCVCVCVCEVGARMRMRNDARGGRWIGEVG